MSGKHFDLRLWGRAEECRTLAELVSTVRTGPSQVLVLHGEAGVGKTALLNHAGEVAAGFRCVQVSGVESDMELAFAGLHQFCAPLLGHLDGLPGPQRDALDVAFGRGGGPPPDRFLVGLAVLSLLAAASDERPLLCVIDDAQWLDQVSLQTLGFVARRLMAEPVAMMFAVRDHTDLLAGLPEMTVEGLSSDAAGELLDSVMLGGIDPRVRDRIVAETRGVPLAILEVPRSASPTELAGGFWISGKRSSAAALEDDFVRRIRSLPQPTQRLLLVAAAEPLGDAGLFLRATATMGIAVDALAPAEAAGLIEFGPRMRFHHPLVRSAVYRSADLVERRAIHRALADATDPDADPDRRAWHAANAAAGPDDVVADQLEASAGRAESRGGIAATAAFLERATALTSDPARRGARALAAATAKRDAAAPTAAAELLDVAEQAPLSDLRRAQAIRLRAQMEFVRSRGGDSRTPQLGDLPPRLLDAAARLEPLDDYAARETYLEALAAVMYAGRLGDPAGLARVAEAVRGASRRLAAPVRPVDFLLHGMSERFSGGIGVGAALLRDALERMCAQARGHELQIRRWLVPGFPILQESAAHELWDEAMVLQLSTAVIGHARATGALAVLPQALVYRAGVHLLAGEFGSATTLVEEANAITSATDHYAPARYHALLLTAWQGAPAETGAITQAAESDAIRRGEGRLLGLTGYAKAVLYNGLARYADALTVARKACEYEDPGFYNWALFELIEAATRTGDAEIARWGLDQLEHRAGVAGTHWALGTLANARALLADGDEAADLYTDAIAHLERTGVAVHLARTRLHFGEWLRRTKRRAEARACLAESHDMFTRMGAQAFAERARRELLATGEKVRRQPTGPTDALTAQEAQIARLAGEGLTNQEIGAQLFISTHTVEWHLRKVFAKLGIDSRRQLRTVPLPR